MRLERKPAPFSQVLSKNLLPVGLNSSLVPVTPESPAWCYPASRCKRLDQTQRGACLVHKQGLKHSSQPLPFHHCLSLPSCPLFLLCRALNLGCSGGFEANLLTQQAGGRVADLGTRAPDAFFYLLMYDRGAATHTLRWATTHGWAGREASSGALGQQANDGVFRMCPEHRRVWVSHLRGLAVPGQTRPGAEQELATPGKH